MWGGVFSIPWFNGILSLLFIGIAGMFIVDLLGIHSGFGAILTGALLVTFPVTATAYAFMFNAWSDFFCFLLNVVAVWLLAGKRCILRFSIGAILISLALGVYQAMFSISTTLLLLVLILSIVDGKYKNFIAAIKQAVYYLAALICGMCSYLLINKAVITFGQFKLASYKGVDEIGQLELEKIPERVVVAYLAFFDGHYANIHRSVYFAWIIRGIIIVTLIMFIILFLKEVDLLINRITLFIFLGLYPLGMNIVYLFSTKDDFSVHTLMIYSMVFVLITPIVLFERLERLEKSSLFSKFVAAIEGGLALLLLSIVCIYVYFNNAAYLKATFLQEQTIAWYNGLIAEIKGTEGYKDEYPVAYIGMYYANDLNLASIPSLENAVMITGYEYSQKELINDYKMYEFMRLRCGYEPQLYEDTEKLEKLAEVKDMPCYPDKGAIKVIDGVVVVKFSSSTKGRGIQR